MRFENYSFILGLYKDLMYNFEEYRAYGIAKSVFDFTELNKPPLLCSDAHCNMAVFAFLNKLQCVC